MATPNLQSNVLNCINFELCIHNVLGIKPFIYSICQSQRGSITLFM